MSDRLEALLTDATKALRDCREVIRLSGIADRCPDMTRLTVAQAKRSEAALATARAEFIERNRLEEIGWVYKSNRSIHRHNDLCDVRGCTRVFRLVGDTEEEKT